MEEHKPKCKSDYIPSCNFIKASGYIFFECTFFIKTVK